MTLPPALFASILHKSLDGLAQYTSANLMQASISWVENRLWCN